MCEEERANIIKETIDDNLYLLLEYMDTQQQPTPDFLAILIKIQPQLDEQAFSAIFVRLCSYQKIDDLKITLAMAKNAMVQLTETRLDARSAFGLLRLVYSNQLSLASFPKTTLMKFQHQYE